MRKVFMLFMLLCVYGSAWSQDEINLSGLVTDTKKSPLIGVTVTVKDNPGLGTITDIDGKYNIKVSPYSTLIFTYLGFDKQEIKIKTQTTLDVVMKESQATTINEVVVTGLGTRQRLNVSGAITTVNPEDLHTPSSSVANALAGNVPGIMARQISGQPGQNVSEFWIRGISTFGAGSSALVIVDGFERSLNEINVEDIESFSVLKDASATAIYGSRGANGVVLITTKHGKEGKVNINAKAEYSYNQRIFTPETIDGVEYASMMNEALTTRNKAAAWTDSDLRLIANGLDKDLFPNINWVDLMMKKGAPTYKADINVSGGGTLARYFLSGSYVEEGGMYKAGKAMKDQYDSNADYHRWNYRMNTDVNITRTTLLSLGISGSVDKQNSPGSDTGTIWGSLLGHTPISGPPYYSNGYHSAADTEKDYYHNPYDLITNSGYIEKFNNKIQITANLEQNFDFITKGLKFMARLGFDTNETNYNNHLKSPAFWKAEHYRDSEGNLVFTKIADEKLMEVKTTSISQRILNLEAEIHYDRTFGNHTVGAILKYAQDETKNTHGGLDYIGVIPHRHQGLIGRVSYGWMSRYFADFNFGYTGSENFATGHQYGFFPAGSVAWNIGEEPWVQKHLPWMEMFKIRYSYGKVGNDNLGDTNRFPYHSTFQEIKVKNSDDEYLSYNFADAGTSFNYRILTYANISSPYVTWEIAKKHDLGIDFSFFHDNISGTVDYFAEHRTGIYMERKFLPEIIGLRNLTSTPHANVGAVKTKGIDGNISLHQKFGTVDVTFRGNWTYSKNTIDEYDEEYTRYPYLLNKGFRVDQARGLIAEGLFTSYDDIRNSPTQQFGEVAPGDIKYKDVNGDGLINNNDIVPVGTTTRPNLIYGFGVSALWNGFDVNVHFQGAGKSSFFAQGFLVRTFQNKDWGNISTDLIGNYWSLGTNENPNAKYPRLTYGPNDNNNRNSTYWLRDGSYLRLKTLEIGYTLPKKWLLRTHITKMRLYFLGTNLLTFAKFKLWDPELGSSTGLEYPLSRVYTFGMTVSL